jgi:nucleotide-binding universal stress UspA family protein
MFHSICVPLDGSPFSEGALPLARAIAGKTGASINLALMHPYWLLRLVKARWILSYHSYNCSTSIMLLTSYPNP